jgi:16S rRNA (uracil1498-N3)-methyltransferase
MTRRRWIADEFSAQRAALTGAHAAHLARTLRARVGQRFDIACGDAVRQGTITSVNDDRVEFALGEAISAPTILPITLLLAVFKFDRMEWAIEKCTELNVTRIVPVIARRTEKHLALAAEKRVERWRRIAREATEQSRRVSPPEIGAPVQLKDALGIDGCKDDLRIVLSESERDLTLKELLREQDSVEALALAVGPEGAWTAEELQTFSAARWQSASLGETVLRAETAAIAALAVARAEL